MSHSLAFIGSNPAQGCSCKSEESECKHILLMVFERTTCQLSKTVRLAQGTSHDGISASGNEPGGPPPAFFTSTESRVVVAP